MSETKYDAAILQKYADDLYSQAQWVIFSTAFVYGLVTFVLFIGAAAYQKIPSFQAAFILAVIGAAVGAAVGAYAGQRKAFQLKLEAQKVLCQRQVELNTRTSVKPEALSATAGK